ncbi:hypothetical protein MUO79_12190 [Candidatus Bathyarchaeota archaeon]|nr:hypothetical protein [Candidatus Bathyarchaeota archaeon]
MPELIYELATRDRLKILQALTSSLRHLNHVSVVENGSHTQTCNLGYLLVRIAFSAKLYDF